MKKIYTLIVALAASLSILAQAPAMINYQGIARNSTGNVLANQNVNMRLSIHDLSSAGAIVYSETRLVNTSSIGVFSVAIGGPGATSATGTLNGINWANGTKYLQVEMDPSGGNSFLNMGTTQLLSVPYALAAGPIGPAGGDLSSNYPNPTVAKIRGINVTTTAPVTNNVLSYNGTDWTPSSLAGIGAASGTGTLNYVSKWTPNTTSLGNSLLFDNGISIGVGTTTPKARFSLVVSDTESFRSQVDFSTPPNVSSFRSANTFISTNANFGIMSKTGAIPNSNHPPQGSAGVFGFDSTEIILANGVTGYSVGNMTGRAGVYGFGSKNASPTTSWYWSGFSGGTFVGGDNGVSAIITDGAPSADIVGDQLTKAGVNAYVSYTNPSGTNYGLYILGVSGGGTNYAGYFNGNLSATGSKAFRIDHPLDPANKYLSHYAVESPEVQNVYTGNIVTDASGKATVHLPDYFSTINRDFKYQLTIVDENRFAQARVSRKIKENSFEIMTDKPKVEVSWQVTAIRNDKASQEFVTPAVTEKPANERGRYLNPELYNQPHDRGIHSVSLPVKQTSVKGN